jgi:hypothetical protein
LALAAEVLAVVEMVDYIWVVADQKFQQMA